MCGVGPTPPGGPQKHGGTKLKKHAVRFDLLLESARAGIARAKRNVPLLKAQGRIAENIARSADSGIQACLEECCLLLRGTGDKEGARASIRTACDFASEIVDVARHAESMRDRKSHWLYSMNFMNALIAALMGRSFALASDLAGALRFDAVTEEEGHASDIEPRLYGAVIENDQQLFSAELARYRTMSPGVGPVQVPELPRETVSGALISRLRTALLFPKRPVDHRAPCLYARRLREFGFRSGRWGGVSGYPCASAP